MEKQNEKYSMPAIIGYLMANLASLEFEFEVHAKHGVNINPEEAKQLAQRTREKLEFAEKMWKERG